MTIRLDLTKALRDNLLVDRNKYLEEHDCPGPALKMLKGTSLLISIEGSYINIDDLPNLVVNKYQGSVVNQWVSNVKRAVEPALLVFKWRRS